MSSLCHRHEHALAGVTLILAGLAVPAVSMAADNTRSPELQAKPQDVPGSGLFPNDETEPPLGAVGKAVEGNTQAISEGARLFNWYNCSGCHFHGAGGIGPAFDDQQWLYGGRIDQIFESIYHGRPNGMPMWGNTIPPAAIWDLAAYVKSLSTDALGKPVPTKPVAAAPGPATLETEPDQTPSTPPPASK